MLALADYLELSHVHASSRRQGPGLIDLALKRLGKQRRVVLPELPFDPVTVPRLTMTACGSAYLAGLVGRYWIEELARLPVDADFASEFRYRDPPLPYGGGALLVSQSGETADTMAALRLLKERGQRVLSIVNVPESTMARESDAAVLTVAGPEIGVASTKAFT
ncbi:MAG: SIS domain-containing protein [Acetobacteraceae bacterium]|nr:SIS domain-containing protein [Acetobacteraceae bacterium]